MSIIRAFTNLRKLGFREWFSQMHTIGDPKVGTLVGTDFMGNRYFENLEEQSGRHRWVLYGQYDLNASQVPPEWHAWLNHIRKDSPDTDPVMIASQQKWKSTFVENMTGTRGAYKTYSTTKPKMQAWEPKVASRSA